VLYIAVSSTHSNGVVVDELDYLVTTLATMGYEGAYMCKWFITDDNFWMTPEELYDRLMEEIRAAEKRHKVD